MGDVDTVRAALTDPRPEVRATALGALARLDALTDVDVRAGLTDEAPIVRRRACELSVAFAVDLIDALRDEDDMVVESAAWALGERAESADAAAVTALAATATAHDEPLCREAAVAALGAIGDPAGLAAILTATSDKPAVRRRAVIALAPFDGPEVDAALQRALDDRDWQVRQAAEDQLRDD
ncbi:MAG TPA: HEAT repeat domain-containing protein [Acidimicrobiales bacterium]|nr:HEAT repeat domain-containing protein [Acidimicrobiales bacterium]